MVDLGQIFHTILLDLNLLWIVEVNLDFHYSKTCFVPVLF